MGALLWLLIPVGAAVTAVLYSAWASRHRKTGDVAELAGYEKFRAVMERERTGQTEQTEHVEQESGSRAA